MKKRSIIIFGIMLVLFSISFVSAYKWLCLTHGDKYPMGTRTCDHDICQLCVTDEGFQAFYTHCNDLPSCVSTSASVIDSEPPNITVLSPLQGGIYNSASVLFSVKTDEACSLYYIDNIEGRGRWSRVCTSCLRYSNNRRFDEGFNNITIKCTDKQGNSATAVREFRIDSKKPKITKTGPRNGLTSGDFEVQFKEENPTSLILHYGNSSKKQTKSLNLTKDCYEYKSKQYCSTNANLKPYNGQEIEYWFELKDIAGSSDESRPINLDVDTTFPVLNNNKSFWKQGNGTYSKYIYFTFNVTEKNFGEITYAYKDDRGVEREKRICSSLKGSLCEKKEIFRKGNYTLNVQITDEAGNAIAESIKFKVDY
jgi:hypothetical protein